MSLRRVGFVLFAAVLAMAAGPRNASAISCCVVGEESCFNSNITEASCPNDNICGCEVSGSNCTLTLSANASTSSTSTCLTLGSGVTFDMNGKTLNCTGSDCGKAVHNKSSGGSSNKVVVKNGTITGCFDAGLYFDASGGSNTDSSVSDMLIDLGSSCTNGITYSGGDVFNVGISTPKGTIARVHVKNADIGVVPQSTEAIEDSILSDNAKGMMSSVSAIDNVLFLGNSYHLWEWKGSYDPDISGSTFVDAGTCDCATTPSGASNAASCQAGLTNCGTFQAPPSHNCDGAPATCTIED